MTSTDVERPSSDGSLRGVRAAIPARCLEPSTARGLLPVALDVALYVLALALLAGASSWWAVVPLELLAGLAVSGLFVLAHDAAHGALVPSERTNRWVARMLMLPSLHVREAWALGHNRIHHGFTARQGLDFVWHPCTAPEYLAMTRAQRLRHRFEWSVLGSGAYYLREVWWNRMVAFRPSGPRAAAIGRDRRFVAFWAIAATAGTLWLGWAQEGTAVAALTTWAKLVVVPFLLFAYVIGWTVYVHHVGPDIPWWTREEWTRRRAQTESTTILRAPWLLNVFLHNIFVHVPHHVDVRIPWYHLPRAAEAITASVPGVVDRPLRLRDHLRATRRCKLYDFDARAWGQYPRPDGR